MHDNKTKAARPVNQKEMNKVFMNFFITEPYFFHFPDPTKKFFLFFDLKLNGIKMGAAHLDPRVEAH